MKPVLGVTRGHWIQFSSLQCIEFNACSIVDTTALRSPPSPADIYDQLTVPRSRRITFGHRAFSVVDTTVWNSIPTEFRDLTVSFGDFRRTAKTIIIIRAILARSAQWCTENARYCDIKFPILFYSVDRMRLSIDVQ